MELPLLGGVSLAKPVDSQESEDDMKEVALAILALVLVAATAAPVSADCVFTGKWTDLSPGERPIFKCDDTK